MALGVKRHLTITVKPCLPCGMNDMAVIRNRRGLMARVAKGLGLSRSAVSLWERVPAEVVVEVERITEIPREQLRPDLYRHADVSVEAA